MKRGISLIAVLMFMLAATTSSVVLYKWLSSENFASGARLKHSEAYQASESGLDAVRAWLSYNAADVGGVLKEHFDNAQAPYHLNNQANNVISKALGSLDNNQNFNVYLIGADISNRHKLLKFMSIGTGRDGSKVKQTAIFNVEGLYNVKIQSPKGSTDFNDDFWGNMGTVNIIESMNVVMTQTAEIKNAGGQGLNEIKIGKDIDNPGYLILDGNYYVNHGMNIYGDMYVTGDFDFCSTGSLDNDYINGYLYIGGIFHPKGALTIQKDAFFKGGVNPNAAITVTGNSCSGTASAGTIKVEENSTIQGDFFYWNHSDGSQLGFHVGGNLVMDNGNIILTRQDNNSDSLAAMGNVYIANNLTGTIPADNNASVTRKAIPYFGQNPSSIVCVPNMTSENSPDAPPYYYRDNTSNTIKMRSDRSNVASISTSCADYTNWGADPLDGSKNNAKDLKGKLEEAGGLGDRSCENTPIKFDMTIYEAAKQDNPPTWVHRKDKWGACKKTTDPNPCTGSECKLKLADPNAWINLGAELQDCRDRTTTLSSLYNDEWLVIYMKDRVSFNDNPSSLSSGKYIIILDMETITAYDPNHILKLPPTAQNVQVMLYLPKGYPSKIELSGTGQYYNYFIFSDGNIYQFDTTNERKLTGNVFMNNCSVMNSPTAQGNPHFISEGNRSLIEELMANEILQKNEAPSSSSSCEGENCPSSSSTQTANSQQDPYLIPLSPRLKVELESKYISKEPEPSEDVETVKGSILVMPRIIRLTQEVYTEATTTSDADKKLSKYYNLLYLNGATKQPGTEGNPPPEPTPTCTPSGTGVYKCTFGEGSGISEFYVKIGAAPATPSSSSSP